LRDSFDRAESHQIFAHSALSECGGETISQNKIQVFGLKSEADSRREGWATQWHRASGTQTVHENPRVAVANLLQVNSLQLTLLDGIFYDKRLILNILARRGGGGVHRRPFDPNDIWNSRMRRQKKLEKRIPRGLKPTRNDRNNDKENKEACTAHLKVRPFKTTPGLSLLSSLECPKSRVKRKPRDEDPNL